MVSEQTIPQWLNLNLLIPDLFSIVDDLHCAIFYLFYHQVPDRGGRTGGMQAPPPEMPSFMKRQVDPHQDQRSFCKYHNTLYKKINGVELTHPAQNYQLCIILIFGSLKYYLLFEF